MRIGIDIDDTIAETNQSIVREALKYDKNSVKGRGFKNKDAYSLMEMFYWTVLDLDGFMQLVRAGKFFTTLDPVEGAVENVNKLYQDGHEILFITRRQNNFKTKMKTKKWLKDKGFKYHKLLLGSDEKDEICSDYGIEFFIDNDIKNIVEVSALGIPCVLKGTNFNKGEEEYKRIESWDAIYDYLNEVK